MNDFYGGLLAQLKPYETELLGCWERSGNSIIADAVCKRIDALVTSYLKKVAEDVGGWNTLYQDPEDMRYWELSYSDSEMHGGGPPHLIALSKEQAMLKYRLK